MARYSKFEPVELLASAARTATSTGSTPVRLLEGMKDAKAVAFELDLTAAATDAGDLLDVYVQVSLDNTNYVDIVHFPQCLGNGGAKRYVAKVQPDLAMVQFENATALTAGGQRNLLAGAMRVRYTVVDAGTDNASFTFSVHAVAM